MDFIRTCYNSSMLSRKNIIVNTSNSLYLNLAAIVWVCWSPYREGSIISAQEEHRLPMRSSIYEVSSHFVFRELLILRYFSRRYNFQVEAAGRFTEQSLLFTWLSGAVTTFRPVSSLRFRRFFPVIVLTFLLTSLATTATS